ncbi:MAG: hypothetical protein U0795_26485 [Pirellulales bacterium]
MPFEPDAFQDLYAVRTGLMSAQAVANTMNCLEEMANNPRVADRTRRQAARAIQTFAQKQEENATKREQLELRAKELEVTKMEQELRRLELELRLQQVVQARAVQPPAVPPIAPSMDYDDAVRQIVSRSGLDSALSDQ